MQVGVIGVNFKTADVSFREAVAKGAALLEGQKGLFFDPPTVLLSTCNRTELYFSAEDLSRAHAALLSFLRRTVGGDVEQRLYSLFEKDCLLHLCRVAAGFESALFLETAIQRQIKLAYAKAHQARGLPAPLHYLFQKALQLSKRIRSQIAQEERGGSLCSALWDIGGERWRGEVLLVGYSQVHRDLASFLAHRGVLSPTFCTRFPDEVRRQGMRACSREEIERWRTCDIVSCAASAEHFLLFEKSHKEVLLFDLGVPRNIDPEVGKEKGVALWNIDAINQRVEQNKLPLAASYWEEQLRQAALRLATLYALKMQPLSRKEARA